VVESAATIDLAIIGTGAAGLMAAIWAGRTARETHAPINIVTLDGAKRLGAKILVAGGGRCNVTHDVVTERDYAGASPNAIRKVLGRFDVPRTIDFFKGLGVELKREETGKLFPTTDDAHTVLNALLTEVQRVGVRLVFPWRVASIRRENDLFIIQREGEPTTLSARRLILATGGMALPKTGSDGLGYSIARSLGHTITPHIFPALVPLTLPKDHWLTALSGITLPTTLELRAATAKRLSTFTDSTLLTHFGLSGPSVLDISRHLTAARRDDPGAHLVLNWLPGEGIESFDAKLQALAKASAGRFLCERLPERVVRALCDHAGVDFSAPAHTLTRERRRALATLACETPLPVTGDRGFTYAEATAGGVPLSEVHLDTMESRVCPGLHLCGELLDVDGRVGGYNFQWAWASGCTAGTGAVRGLLALTP
jgi:predicted Rossmann fold flavoprotein